LGMLALPVLVGLTHLCPYFTSSSFGGDDVFEVQIVPRVRFPPLSGEDTVYVRKVPKGTEVWRSPFPPEREPKASSY